MLISDVDERAFARPRESPCGLCAPERGGSKPGPGGGRNL